MLSSEERPRRWPPRMSSDTAAALLGAKLGVLLAVCWALLARWGVNPIGFSVGLGALVLGMLVGLGAAMGFALVAAADGELIGLNPDIRYALVPGVPESTSRGLRVEVVERVETIEAVFRERGGRRQPSVKETRERDEQRPRHQPSSSARRVNCSPVRLLRALPSRRG